MTDGRLTDERRDGILMLLTHTLTTSGSYEYVASLVKFRLVV